MNRCTVNSNIVLFYLRCEIESHNFERNVPQLGAIFYFTTKKYR